MPNAQAFSNGFSNGFGFNNAGGQLLLVVGSHPTYEDGDILVAKNRRATRCIHAEHICWERNISTGKKVGGFLGATYPLLEIMYSNIYQYKFERVSKTEVRRTDLLTLDEEILSLTPNVKGESIDVDLYVRRRNSSASKPLFGTEGAEIWYGGNINASHDKLDIIWGEIEDRTTFREVDHLFWNFTPLEKRLFLAISVDDFDDQTSGDLTSSLVDDTDPENPLTIKKRKHNVTGWRDLRDVVVDNVLNKNVEINIHGLRKHIRSEIVLVKSLP